MDHRPDTRLRKLRQAPLCGERTRGGTPGAPHGQFETETIGHLWLHRTCRTCRPGGGAPRPIAALRAIGIQA
jgi:hypothetical protein